MGVQMNYENQDYKGIPLQLICRNYQGRKAKRYIINNTNQNVWIPNKHLDEMGNIKDGENINYVFRSAKRKLEIAGVKVNI